MSDLTATHCGCNSNVSNSGSCGMMGGNFLWIILLLCCCNGNDGGILGGNSGCGILGGNSGCGNNGCDWLIWILLISCFCGNNNGCC